MWNSFLMDAPSSFNPLKIDVFSSFLSDDWFPPAEASLKRSLIRKLIHGLVTEPSQNYPKLIFSNEQLDERHERSENAERELAREFLAQRCSAGEPDSVCTVLGTQQPSTSICLNDSEEKEVPASGCILETGRVSMVAVQNLQESGVCRPDKDTVVCLSSQDEKNEPPPAYSDNQLDLRSCAPEDAEVFKGSGCVVKDKYTHEESLLDSLDNNQKISSQAEVEVHGIMDSKSCSISDNAEEVMVRQEHSLEINTNEIEDERCGASQDMHSAMMLDAIKEDIGPDPERTTGEAEDGTCDLSEDTDSVTIGDINKDVAERSLERNIVEAEDTKPEDTRVDPIMVEDAIKDNVKETSTTVDEINDSEQYVSSELKEGNTDNGMTSGSTVSSELREGNTVKVGDSTNGTDETHEDGEDAYANLVTGEAVPCEDDTTCTDAEMPLVDGTCSAAKNETIISEETTSDAKRPLPGSTCEEKDIVLSDDRCLQKDVQGTDAKIERHYKRRKVVPSEVDKRHTRSTSRARSLD